MSKNLKHIVVDPLGCKELGDLIKSRAKQLGYEYSRGHGFEESDLIAMTSAGYADFCTRNSPYGQKVKPISIEEFFLLNKKSVADIKYPLVALGGSDKTNGWFYTLMTGDGEGVVVAAGSLSPHKVGHFSADWASVKLSCWEVLNDEQAQAVFENSVFTGSEK